MTYFYYEWIKYELKKTNKYSIINDNKGDKHDASN